MKKLSLLVVPFLALLVLTGCAAASPQEKAEALASEYMGVYTGASDGTMTTCDGDQLSASTDALGEFAHESTEELDNGDWEVRIEVARADGSSYRFATTVVKSDGSCIVDAS